MNERPTNNPDMALAQQQVLSEETNSISEEHLDQHSLIRPVSNQEYWEPACANWTSYNKDETKCTATTRVSQKKAGEVVKRMTTMNNKFFIILDWAKS
ncbi:UDP glucuronosyltransferase 5 family, polypeptide C3 isoform X8 [Danio rerio]|uniref:UDP glucuronosyltransferase 5 family, polypeptide C3 isoform X8 n=1 Tax=Danio rerio TaxID=7955 RepID=A0AC58HTR8_DANRE